MNRMTESAFAYANEHLLQGHDVIFKPIGRSIWLRPFMGGPGEVRTVLHPYCLTCVDELPKIALGEPIYEDELTHWPDQPPHVSCPHDPRSMRGAPIGMYHCPDCGAMVLAGRAHPKDADVLEQGVTPYARDAKA